MADQKPGMIRDLVKGALTTAISVLVTYFVTSAIKKDQYQKDDFDKEKQHAEAFEKTNKILSDYVSRYDSLHAKYIGLINQRSNIGGDNYVDEQSGYPANSGNSFNTVSQTLLNGNWVTPDGSYSWNFANNRLTIRGIGTYENSYDASGSYQVAGGVVSGSYHVSKFFYVAVNYNYRFEATVNTDGNILYGSMTDDSGSSYTLALYKR